MNMTSTRNPIRVRSLFISDVHLGYRGCRADYLLDFLDSFETRNLFILGDLIDFWALRRSFYWPQSHQQVLASLLQRAAAGTRVVYVPGNHDEVARGFCGKHWHGVEVQREFVHTTAEGLRMLLLHGDEFDESVANHIPALAKRFGGYVYDVMLAANHGLHALRRRVGYGYWSLADWLKQQLPNAVDYINRFEEAAAGQAARRGFDGVICGHIHRPALRRIEGVLYCNDGDWVESCTSLVEDMNGRLATLRWTGQRELLVESGHERVALNPAA